MMVILLLYMFSAYCGIIKISVCIVRYVKLYDVGKPGTFLHVEECFAGPWDRLLQNAVDLDKCCPYT
jgi:hypothetical protein